MYYNLQLSSDPKIIGVKNGIYQLELFEKMYDSESYQKFKTFFITNKLTAISEFPDSDNHFIFRKLKSAKKTDFMSFCPYLNHCHFLLRNDVLEILKAYRIQSFKVYNALIYNIENDSVDNLYKMFYSVFQEWDVVDFKQTVFNTGGYGKNPIVEHKFVNENELKKFNKITKLKVLALSRRFDSTLDLFQTRIGGVFVSERLKKSFEDNKVTGVEFTNTIEVNV